MGAGTPKDTISKATVWPDLVRPEQYDGEGNHAFYRAAVDQLLEKAPKLSGSGLDLGCGTGFSLEGLVARAPNVRWMGVDCSREMLALSSRKAELSETVLCHARAEALPFASATFDVVVANFSWHWFGAEAGNEVRRVLRPGGRFLACVPLRRFSSAPGNRALAREVLAGRGHFARRASQGFRFGDVPGVLPGPVQILRHELVVANECFADSRQLLDVLRSRGALAAIFGDQPPSTIHTPSPVDFEWPFAILDAQV